LLWCGELISQTGSQITVVALFVQVYAITSRRRRRRDRRGAARPMVLVTFGSRR
jgi:hypothetical protein